MDKELALAILNELRSEGLYDLPTPDYEPEIIKEAKQSVIDAKLAYQKGSRSEIVLRVLRMAGEDPVAPSFDEIIPPIEENFPIPKMIDGEPPHLPKDFSEVSDKKLRSLHAQFAAWESRLTWLLSQEESDEYMAKSVADIEYMKAHANLERMNPETSKPYTANDLDIEAKLNDKVLEWREKQNAHSLKVKKLKALRELCKTAADRISREGTLRMDERNLHH